jgi:hypothetical protein
LQKRGAFRTEFTLSHVCGQGNRRSFGAQVIPGAVYLDKLSDQPDIFFLVPGNRFHECHIPP